MDVWWCGLPSMASDDSIRCRGCVIHRVRMSPDSGNGDNVLSSSLYREWVTVWAYFHSSVKSTKTKIYLFIRARLKSCLNWLRTLRPTMFVHRLLGWEGGPGGLQLNVLLRVTHDSDLTSSSNVLLRCEVLGQYPPHRSRYTTFSRTKTMLLFFWPAQNFVF